MKTVKYAAVMALEPSHIDFLYYRDGREVTDLGNGIAAMEVFHTEEAAQAFAAQWEAQADREDFVSYGVKEIHPELVHDWDGARYWAWQTLAMAKRLYEIGGGTVYLEYGSVQYGSIDFDCVLSIEEAKQELDNWLK